MSGSADAWDNGASLDWKMDNKGYKKVPEFWWDLELPNVVIIECDDDRYPVVATFKYDPMGGEPLSKRALEIYGWEEGEELFTGGCAMGAIEKAEKMIKDLKAGRITIKSVLGKVYE